MTAIDAPTLLAEVEQRLARLAAPTGPHPVQAAAAAIDATFVQLIDPPVLSADLLAADGAHPNDEGHAAIAERVAAGIANR